ncbi:MAG: peptide ABC transporter ATP-binding protein [Thermoprotei archaeon]|nr:MAG: peptide ABC transporter ATP-binding protein [Thermoprotei archaeon]RLF20028.1 MAG: peptide ABC transporter ATP-binding protein [Thermoprotei archaeon]
MSEDVLLVKDLYAGYGNQEVIRGVSLKVSKGEKVVIMGPSGSGKSTLLKSIVRLVEPWKGLIYINSINVLDPRTDIRKVRQMVGFVFQSYNLFPHMTVLRNITLPLETVKKMPKEEAIQKAIKVLRLVGMEEFKDRYPLQLSGGQQQRVAIARALAMDPVLLLLDEPTSALDPELKEEVLDVLRDIAKRGISMLIVTHELDFAEDVADRIVFMDDGRIIEEGPPHRVLYNPRIDRTKKFLRAIARRVFR